MRSVGIINQKGGCGKTTVAMNLAACLAIQGQRTLLVDMDPQNHCAVGLAIPEDQIENNIYDVLISTHTESPMPLRNIIWQISENFDLAPSGIELAALEPQLAGKQRRDECLSSVLEGIKDQYQFVIIDCPPCVGLLTFNALRAADEVIVPVETGYFSLHSLGRQLETLTVLRQQYRQPIALHILANMYDVRTRLAREILHELQKSHKASLLPVIVNFNTKLKEAASLGQPISEYDPTSKGMKDFMALAHFLIENRQASHPGKQYESVDQQLKAMSKTADELMAQAKQTIGLKPKLEKETTPSTQEKIDLFYGVRQQQGKVEFATLYPKATSVFLAGDFNNWVPENTPLALQDKKGSWIAKLNLPKGTYRYRYVVDGIWQEDPYNSHIESNEFGEFNSLLEVK